MSYCAFCNKEVGKNHIVVCPNCGGRGHQADEGRYECETCGVKFELPTSETKAPVKEDDMSSLQGKKK